MRLQDPLCAAAIDREVANFHRVVAMRRAQERNDAYFEALFDEIGATLAHVESARDPGLGGRNRIDEVD